MAFLCSLDFLLRQKWGHKSVEAGPISGSRLRVPDLHRLDQHVLSLHQVGPSWQLSFRTPRRKRFNPGGLDTPGTACAVDFFAALAHRFDERRTGNAESPSLPRVRLLQGD